MTITFSGSNANIVPAQVPGQVAFLDSTCIESIIETSNSVSVWLNISPVANHGKQASGSNQPLTNARTQNGLNVIDFDSASNQYIELDNNEIFDEPFTIFCVGQYDTSTVVNALMGRQTGSIAGQFVMRKEAGGVFNSFLFGSAGSSAANFSGNLNNNIHCAYFEEGGSLNYRINGNSFTAGTARSGYDNTITTPVVIGASNNTPANTLDGFIGEVIVYNRVLTSDEILLITSYLANKWGISI